MIVFSDMFDAAFTMAAELKKMIEKHAPLRLLSDSESTFDVISKGSRTSEKRMMIDIAATREGYKNYSIFDIGFCGAPRILHMVSQRLSAEV